MKSVAHYGDDHILKKVYYEPFIKAMKQFQERFLSTYRKYIEDYYKEIYDDSPSYFPFTESIDWKVVFNNRTIDNYLFESESDLFCTINHQFTTLGESREFNRLPKYKQKEKLTTLLNNGGEPLEIIRVKYGFTAPAIITDPEHVTEDPNDMATMGEIKGREYAELHGETARNEKLERYNVFGLEEVVHKIKSPSFDYELGESISAYKQGLYLAAASTAGIALENILRLLIIKKLGKGKLPDKTYIYNSVIALDTKSILPGRLRAEVLKHTNVRNANSHTNEDPVRRDTVDNLYRIIRDISLLF